MNHASGSRIETDETTAGLLPGAMLHAPRAPVSARTLFVIRQAKAFLEAELANRIRLVDVARAVGASPAHLTVLFRRVEGVPLHRYLIRLRLSRALLQLPYSDDLTKLALDVGFSSHSHFTAAFRRAYGVTPSQVRERTREARRTA